MHALRTPVAGLCVSAAGLWRCPVAPAAVVYDSVFLYSDSGWYDSI